MSPAVVIKHLRSIGADFLREFRGAPIPDDLEGTMQLFRSIEDRSTKMLKDLFAAENSNIPFADGELDLEKQKEASALREYWIFDSMDGAVQYMRHVPGWTFNLVLVREQELSMAFVYDPLHDEMFWAEKGGGAFLNGIKLRAVARPDSKFTMAATSHPPFPNRVPGLVPRVGRSDQKFIEAFSFLRNFGPTALQIAYVAAGRLDVFGEEGLDTFNWLPGVLIAQEAGAEVLTSALQPWTWGADSIFVGAPGMATRLTGNIP